MRSVKQKILMKKRDLTDEQYLEQMEALRSKEQELNLLQSKLNLIDGLPHLYGQKLYKWQRTFFESTNRKCFIVASNQIGKSTIQIKKIIDLATAQEKWSVYWKHRPRIFWYFYPTMDMCNSEIETKWVHLLPQGEYKTSKKYGWSLSKAHGFFNRITFNSGVNVFFKSYAMGKPDLQAGTIDYVACDEELPYDLFPELSARMFATRGYMSMVFTATLGQEIWRLTMEERGEKEKFKGALKIKATMFDCLEYEDGSKSDWTTERIQDVINSCATEVEVQRRVYAKFVVSSGLKYSSFNRERNVVAAHPMKLSSGQVYAGVDIGTGGSNHPAAICFVWVDKEFTKARVFKGWRGDGEITAVPDILDKFKKLKGDMTVTGQYYDHQSKEFQIIGLRTDQPFQPADKGRDKGEMILNTLFRSNALQIFDLPELEGLVHELGSLKNETNKREAVDDYIDALRYAVSSIPWNWEKITGDSENFKEKSDEKKIIDERTMDRSDYDEKLFPETLEDEFRFWNSEYGEEGDDY